MNGDNRLHLGVICQSVEEADVVWAVCVRDVHRTLDRLRIPAWALGGPARHAVAVGASSRASLLRFGADFRARRGSMNGADLRALWVLG